MSENHLSPSLSIQHKLGMLRAHLSAEGFQGFIVPHTDEYLSEYTPADAERLEWMTGFTGSSGVAAILLDKALALTDGRYAIQIKEQIDPSFYEIADMANLTLVDWMKTHVKSGQVIGYDPQLHTQKQITEMLEKLAGTGIELKPILKNPIDRKQQSRNAKFQAGPKHPLIRSCGYITGTIYYFVS